MNAASDQHELDVRQGIGDGTLDRLILTIIQKEDEKGLTDALNERRFPHTRIDTKGSFLQVANTVFAVLFHYSQREEVLGVLRQVCRTRTRSDPGVISADPFGAFALGARTAEYLGEVEVGGATTFELSIEDHQRI